MRLAVIGGSLTGNKGAASMVHGVLDALPEANAVILSPLGDADRSSPGVRATVVDFGPADIILACLLAPVARLTRGRVATRALRALREADVVADVSGVSFVSGRGVATLAYNVLLMLPALVLDRPVVKVSQAMGPFDDPATRVAARFVLSRVAAVLPRGERTTEHLDQLGVAHHGTVPDAAFLMAVTDEDQRWAVGRLEGSRPVVVIPSQVVVDQTEDDGASYRASLTALVDHLTTAGQREVVIMAHSARPDEPGGRLNDIPLCNELASAVARPEHCRVLADGTPQQLRAVMAASELVVTSRFHGMISALATATPVVVVGWSHKYREVLRAFDHEELAVDHRRADPALLVRMVDDTLHRRDEIAADIGAALPGVLKGAQRNAEIVRDTARD